MPCLIIVSIYLELMAVVKVFILRFVVDMVNIFSCLCENLVTPHNANSTFVFH